jgi:hypothetical protein
VKKEEVKIEKKEIVKKEEIKEDKRDLEIDLIVETVKNLNN